MFDLSIGFAEEEQQKDIRKLKCYEVSPEFKNIFDQSSPYLYKTPGMELKVYLLTYDKRLIAQPANILIDNLNIKNFTIL